MAKRVLVVSPCRCYIDGGVSILKDAFCKITLEDGRLSISGVIGPTAHGNAKGSCGQCVDEIRKGITVGDWGWNEEMLQKFCDIWEEWHLNDCRPYCSHMKELGWEQKSKEKVKVSRWTLTREASEAKRTAEKRAVQALKDGKTFRPTKDETTYAKMPYEVLTYGDDMEPLGGSLYRESYELKERDVLGHPNVEYKTRGWIRYKDTCQGMLGKPCPVCGYAYGTSWIKEEVPEEVINWPFSLPKAYKQPAWV